MVRVVAVLLCLMPAPAWAEDSPEERAKASYKLGLEHYEKKRYREAIDAFKKSYALSEKPALLFNIAQAHRLAGDCKPALSYYREYIAAEPRSPHSTEVKQRIGEMEECLKKASAPRPSAPKPEPVPSPAPVPDPDPDPDPEAETESGTGTGTGTGSGSGSGSEIVPYVDQDPGQAKRIGGLVAGGVGIVLIGTSVYFGLRAQDAADRVNQLFDEGGEWTQEYRDIEAQGKGDQTLSYVLGGVGIAAVAAGTIFYVWGASEDVAVVVLPGGAAVRWAGSF